MGNIIQIEFFHVGGKDTNSLAELDFEMHERIMENLPLARSGFEVGSGIKTTARFFDSEDGMLTHLVQKIETLENVYTHTLDLLGTSPPYTFRRWFLGRRLRKIGRQKRRASEYVQRFSIKTFLAVLKAASPVAVESLDRSFRPMKNDERHDVIEKAITAKSLWLFIFEPNDLCADKNKSVAHLM